MRTEAAAQRLATVVETRRAVVDYRRNLTFPGRCGRLRNSLGILVARKVTAGRVQQCQAA